MQKRIMILTLLFASCHIATVYGQKAASPKWINGTWHNSFESHTKNFEFWTFSNDSIFLGKGFLASTECLNVTYSAYKKTTIAGNSSYKVCYSKTNKRIVYEFKLRKISYVEKPVITYSLTINGVKIRSQSTTCTALLIKE